MDERKLIVEMIRVTRSGGAKVPPKEKMRNSQRKKENLQRFAAHIKQLGEEQGLVVTTEDMAQKTGYEPEKFSAFLQGEKTPPSKIMLQLCEAYDHLFEYSRRKNNRAIIIQSVLWIRNVGLAAGMNITLEEMAGKADITVAMLKAYLRDDVATPDSMGSALELAYKKLLRNINKVEQKEDIDTILQAG